MAEAARRRRRAGSPTASAARLRVAGDAQQPPPRLGPGGLRLGRREQAAVEVALDLGELVAVERGLGIALGGRLPATRQRPEHGEHRSPVISAKTTQIAMADRYNLARSRTMERRGDTVSREAWRQPGRSLLFRERREVGETHPRPNWRARMCAMSLLRPR